MVQSITEYFSKPAELPQAEQVERTPLKKNTVACKKARNHRAWSRAWNFYPNFRWPNLMQFYCNRDLPTHLENLTAGGAWTPEILMFVYPELTRSKYWKECEESE